MTEGAGDHRPDAVCRRVLRASERAALATVADGGKGGVGGPWPYASLVLAVCDVDCSPLLLISDLADHTRNLRADPRVSLLYDGTAGLEEPLSGPRVTLQGRAEEVSEPRLLDRYLRRQPSARVYAGFKDFRLFRVHPVRAHLVAGFGRIDWLEAAEFMPDPEAARRLAESESAILDRWNTEQAELFDLYARGLLRKRGKGWRAVGLDPDGIDIRRDHAVARIEFRVPTARPDEALADLRQRLGVG